MNRLDGKTNDGPRDLERLLVETAPDVERDPPPKLRARITTALRATDDGPELERSPAPLLFWSSVAAAVALLALIVSLSLLPDSKQREEPPGELSIAAAVPHLPEGELTFLFEPFVGEVQLLAADLEAAAESLRSSFPRGPVIDTPEHPEENSSER